MQDRLLAGCVKLEDHPKSVRSSQQSCTVDISGGIEDYACHGTPAVLRTTEHVKHAFGTAGIDLKYNSAAGNVNVTSPAKATEEGCPIQVACRVASHTSFRRAAIR